MQVFIISLICWSISWANWKFHIGFDPRAGIVISLASIYDLEKHKSRRVLYKGYISELFVPYQDPTRWFLLQDFLWFWRVWVWSLHCLVGAQPWLIHMFTLLKNAICVFEQYGSIMWRHTETGIPNESVSTYVQNIYRSIRSLLVTLLSFFVRM